MGKVFEVPEGKVGTLFVDGVETELVPGAEYGDGAELVITDKPVVKYSCEIGEDAVAEYRTAIYITPDGLVEGSSVTQAVQGGQFDAAGADGVLIEGTSPDFSAVIVDAGKYTIRNSKLSFITNSDGKKVCDFIGLGAAVVATNGAQIEISDSEIETVGVAKPSVFVDGGSDAVIKDCKISVLGGKLYDGYINSADFNYMVAPPWVLGIMGNARGTNLMGEKASTALINTDVVARNWGVLSTDNGSDNLLTIADCTLTLVGTEEEKTADPYHKAYGSGYGTYILGCHEEFMGVTINAGTYVGIARDGTAVYRSSKGAVKHVSPTTGEVLYEGEGKGNLTVLNSDNFGIMAHGNADLVFTDGTVMNTGDASFLLRCGGINIKVEGGAKLNTASGVILQVIDDDDSTVGVDWESKIELHFHTEFNEKAGWPSENGQISSMMPPPPPPPMPEPPEGEDDGPGMPPPAFDIHFRAADTVLDGSIYNGSGYYGQPAKQLEVILGSGAVLNGAISATETIHVNEKGEQNTHFTIDQYYYLGHVANRNFFNGDNTVEVTLEAGAVWNPTAEGIINKLTVAAGATLNGKVTVDGVEVVPEAGKTYEGKIVVA